jgi:hypothetical protein
MPQAAGLGGGGIRIPSTGRWNNHMVSLRTSLPNAATPRGGSPGSPAIAIRSPSGGGPNVRVPGAGVGGRVHVPGANVRVPGARVNVAAPNVRVPGAKVNVPGVRAPHVRVPGAAPTVRLPR